MIKLDWNLDSLIRIQIITSHWLTFCALNDSELSWAVAEIVVDVAFSPYPLIFIPIREHNKSIRSLLYDYHYDSDLTII